MARPKRKLRRFGTWFIQGSEIPARSNARKPWQNMVVWAMYGIGISSFPIAANMLILWLAGKPIVPTALIGRGELLPISIGLVAAAVRDVLSTRTLSEFANLGITWISFVIIFAAAIVFAAASNPESFNGQNVAEKTVLVSLVVLVFAVLISGANAVQSAESKGDADGV